MAIAKRRQAGFTLLEILVALVVLGLLLVALAGGVDFGTRSWQGQARVIDRSADLQSSDSALRHLIEQADPGLDTPRGDLVGNAHQVAFTSRLTDGAGGQMPVRVTIGVDDRHRLVLGWAPAPNARLLAPQPPPRQDVLLEGIDRLELSYDGPDGWVRSWSGNTLPALVHLHLQFSPGSGRSWPDIVAGPTREALGE